MPARSGGSNAPVDSADALARYRRLRAARALVEFYLDDQAIRVTFDGNPERVQNTHNFAARVSRRPIDDRILRDEIVEFCHMNRLRFTGVDIRRAISLVLLDHPEILAPLIEVKFAPGELERAEGKFKRLAKLVDADERLAIALCSSSTTRCRAPEKVVRGTVSQTGPRTRQ